MQIPLTIKTTYYTEHYNDGDYPINFDIDFPVKMNYHRIEDALEQIISDSVFKTNKEKITLDIEAEIFLTDNRGWNLDIIDYKGKEFSLGSIEKHIEELIEIHIEDIFKYAQKRRDKERDEYLEDSIYEDIFMRGV